MIILELVLGHQGGTLTAHKNIIVFKTAMKFSILSLNLMGYGVLKLLQLTLNLLNNGFDYVKPIEIHIMMEKYFF